MKKFEFIFLIVTFLEYTPDQATSGFSENFVTMV